MAETATLRSLGKSSAIPPIEFALLKVEINLDLSFKHHRSTSYSIPAPHLSQRDFSLVIVEEYVGSWSLGPYSMKRVRVLRKGDLYECPIEAVRSLGKSSVQIVSAYSNLVVRERKSCFESRLVSTILHLCSPCKSLRLRTGVAVSDATLWALREERE
jgi:hypothetical protein